MRNDLVLTPGWWCGIYWEGRKKCGGVLYVVYFTWCTLFGALYVVQSMWCSVCGALYVVQFVWCKVCGAIEVATGR